MTTGLDYAFSHPSMAAVRAAGATFVCRYISQNPANDTNGKNLLPSECATLLGTGLSIVVVVEEGAGWMLYGYAAGARAATHADAVTKALGMPGIPVYFAADFDASPLQQPAINGCLAGAASVIGRSRVGVYGGYYVVKRALDAGKAAFAWQTIAWSGGQWDTRAHIRQGAAVTIGGASCDWDTATRADYGQWPRPVPPPPGEDEEDDDMAMLAAGPAAETVIKFSGGSKTYITFLNDCQRTSAEPPRLRVAVHPTDDTDDWKVTHLTLTPSGADTHGFPVRANGVTVVRDGAGDDVPVGFHLGT